MAAPTSSLQILLSALEEPSSCFVLGAGTSAPLVPIGGELSSIVRERLLAVGSFPANPVSRDEASNRILGPVQKYSDQNCYSLAIQEALVERHLSPAAVHAAAIAVLRPEAPIYAPPQYQVFGLSKYRLALANFNVDGLASQYCSQHVVINMHGTSMSFADRAVLNWDRWINVLQDFPELQGINIPGLLLPQREPKEIAMTKEYRLAARFILNARRLVLIGYSFGSMDDRVAYQLVTSAIRLRRFPSVIAMPDATDLAHRIAEDSKSSTVGALSVYWDKLASAIITSIGRPRHKNCCHERLCYRCIEYLYNAFLDNAALVVVRRE
jgi:hypothetical protein